MKQNTILRRNPSMISSNMDGETVMMSIEKGMYFGLNPVGSRIWDLLDKPLGIEDIIAALIAEYTVDPAQCREEVGRFINLMLDKGLLIADHER